ncbi:MAG: phospholipid carrier-dependent glycosyltransferase [Candidatus Eisenbacteria bacterium]
MHAALTILAGAPCLAAAVPIALTWRSPLIRAVVVGIVGYASLTVAFHILAVLAAMTGGSLVTPGNLAIVAALLGAASWGALVRRIARRHRSDGEEPASSSEVRPRGRLISSNSVSVLVLAVVLAALLASAAASGLSAPPRGWDVLTYHLPRAVSWLQHGDLGAYGPEAAFYPGNAELLILMGLFTGTDRLAPLIQAPFLALAALALFALARTIGARRWSAAIASLVFVASPMAFFHSTVAKNDLIVAALVLSGVLFLLRSLELDDKRNTRAWEISLAGLSLGLAAGTKYTILPFVAALALIVVARGLVRGARIPAPARGTRNRGDVGRVVAAFAVSLALPSAFWYVRNLLLTGSPVAPLLLAESTALPEGWIEQQFQFVSSAVQWWAQPLIDRQGGTYTGSAGFGAAFGMLYIPAIVVCLESVVAKGTAPQLRRKRGALLVAIVLGVAAWWFGGFHLPRYLLPMVALACAPLALVLETVKRRARIVLLSLVVVALAFSAAETMRIVYRDGDLTWSNLGGVERKEFYRVPDVIEKLPAGTKIMLLRVFDEEFYFGTFRYPLVGRLPGNDVVMETDIEFQVSLADMEPAAAHHLLVEAGVDYVFIRVFLHEPFTTWFDEHLDLYEPVYKNLEEACDWYHVPEGSRVMTRIYRVV